MPTKKPCPHRGLYWKAAPADECGWVCGDCNAQPGEPPGYSPALDLEHIETKVSSVLMTMHEAGVVYVSNGIEGDALTESIAAWCRETGMYDSVTIAKRILEYEADDRHQIFWKAQGDAIRAGKDPRRRCHCGQLATVVTGDTHRCSKHWSWDIGGEAGGA